MASEAEIDQEIARAVEQGGDRGWIERMGRYTGVTADLDTGRPGPTLALRFDMDCVDVGEDTSPDHRPAKEGFAPLFIRLKRRPYTTRILHFFA